MMNLALLVGIAACVVFAPTGSEAGQDGWEDIRPTPALMNQLRKVIAYKNPYMIPVKIFRARIQVVAGINYDVTFLRITNRICHVSWWLKPSGRISDIVIYDCGHRFLQKDKLRKVV
ncbi:hypothetical protein GE061_003232 [Apolygus lucorum]|uniref:Cystatin domain-containing protein n=1 Tax=Apolygus lucorum TaxID=248454 RepID=A0A8S9X1H1_APOLU|nr:hypothetical protein GE061_003232 [Apolygus lucorum]